MRNDQRDCYAQHVPPFGTQLRRSGIRSEPEHQLRERCPVELRALELPAECHQYAAYVELHEWTGPDPSGTPSLYSLVEHTYGVTGWKDYSDDMVGNCAANDGNPYDTVNGTVYNLYLQRHNAAPYFAGPSCSTQSVPSGSWKTQQGALYTDLMSGTCPLTP